MKFDSVIKQVKAQRCAGFSYARGGASDFRDVLTVYCDGRVLFERFRAGGEGGRVCALWARKGADDAGRILWEEDAGSCSGAAEAPKVLTGAGAGGLVFDGRPVAWALCEQRRTDAANGYGALKTWFLCRFGRGKAASPA